MRGKVFERFGEQSPISVMVRGMLERILGAHPLHAWYECMVSTYPRTRSVGILVHRPKAGVFAPWPTCLRSIPLLLSVRSRYTTAYVKEPLLVGRRTKMPHLSKAHTACIPSVQAIFFPSS